MKRLTDVGLWDSCYAGRSMRPFNPQDWKNYVSVQTLRLIESLDLHGKKIAEIGGGDAQMTCFLARKYPSSSFAILDTSPEGCRLAQERANKEGCLLDIYEADLFAPPTELVHKFDVVYSFGLVEHFDDLNTVLRAKANLLNKDGVILTIIPNLASPVYRYLCRRWSEAVYQMHVPHDMRSFSDGHMRAHLKVIRSGFLGSVEFGMLSMAFTHGKKSFFDRMLYLYLTRLSKLIHLFEYKIKDFPKSPLFSPFMYIVSKKNA